MSHGGSRRGSGRGKLGDDKLTAVIAATRLTSGERQLIEEAAAQEGLSLAGAVRRALAEWVQRVLK